MKHLQSVITKIERERLLNKMKQWDAEENAPKLTWLQRADKWLRQPSGIIDKMF